jgi:sec-independent protein translocase protein TatB
MPEFLVIAVVALLVLGPERLPEVMRKAGQMYRQAREVLSQYQTEAQRMFEEGMREVEEVSSSISGAWQEGAGDGGNAGGPPPRLWQVPPAVQAPQTAPAAGPWVLPAWYRDTGADLEPEPAGYPQSPFALPRLPGPADQLFAELDRGAPVLMGPGAPEPDLLAVPDLPELPEVIVPVQEEPAREPERGAGSARGRPEPAPVATAVDELAPAVMNSLAVARATANGADNEREVRQRTVVELYRTGDISLERGAAFLGMSVEEFRALLKRV